MPSPLGSESARRLLIAAGTSHFEELADSDLPGVPNELKRMATSFAALGYKRQKAKFSYDPDSSRLRDLFADAKRESRDGDLVVAYYTGHGARDPERFYLLARNSTDSDLDKTALPAEDLARALIKGSKASQVLLILDACYAGAGAAEFLQIANHLAVILAGGPAVYVVAAARPKQEAKEGALSSALAKALANDDARLGGLAQPFLAMDEVIGAVNSYLRQTHPTQTAILSTANVIEGCRLLPNRPRETKLRSGLDLETQRALAEHWVSKARGVEVGAGGWYFTGRERALRELAAWLSADRSDGRARVVTGGPGCGKSALLARIVTLAHPDYRKDVLTKTHSAMLDPTLLPPEGVVNVAVHARHKLLAEVAAQIAVGLDLAARDSAELLAAVARRPEKTVIVVDALDEADDKDQIASGLLRPLAKLPQIFLLVGTRPDSSEHGRRFRGLGEEIVEIDLDHPRYVGTDDVARYVERRLLAAEEPGRLTPYRDSPEIARMVAKAVGERAGGVFLVAHTAVQALLAAASIVDVTRPGWVELLPTGLDSAFAQFLAELDTRRPSGVSSAKARAVLLPLAFAEGEGLPWVDLWAATASALSDSDVSDADVALVREHAAAFIVEAVEQDRSVYHLYHERLADLLRGSVVNLMEAQQRIVEALRSRVPASPDAKRPDWTRAHPYTRLHLAAHALKAGTLGELVKDGLFLATADPFRALQALSGSTDPQTRRVYACYSLACDNLHDQPTDVRLSYLQMTARQQADDEMAEIWERDGLPRRWTAPWARWSPATLHHAISVPAEVDSVALGTHDGRPMIVSGGRRGATVQVWDLISGAPRGKPLRGHEGRVAVGMLSGRSMIVSGGRDGTVRVWDLASDAPHGEPLLGHKGEVNSVAVGTLKGRPVIVSGGADATVRVWDLASGKPRGKPLRGHKGRVTSLALGTLEGRPVIVSGGADETVRVWDLASGKPKGKPLRGHEGGVTSVAIGTFGGWQEAVIASCTHDKTLRVWYLAKDTPPQGSPTTQIDGVYSVAVGTLEDRPVLVSGGWDGIVRVWDLASGTRRELRGHEGFVWSIALGTLDGRPVIVSSGTDKTLRVWDLAANTPQGVPTSNHKGNVNSVAVGTLEGRLLIVSGGDDATARIWDVDSGALRGEPLGGHAGVVWSVAVGTLAGQPVIVSGAWDGVVRVWDLASGKLHCEPLCVHCRSLYLPAVRSVAVATLDGRPVIVSGGHDTTVRVWDLDARVPLYEPLRSHEGPVFSVAVGSTLDGRPLIVSGVPHTVQVWDLASGAPVGEPLRGHLNPVWSVAVGALQGRPVIVSGGDDGTVRVWDLASRTPRGEPLRGHEGGVTAVAIGTLEGRPVIVSGGVDSTVRLWNAGGGIVSKVRIGSRVNALAFANAGKFAVATARGLLLLQFGMEAITRSAEHKV